MGRERLTPGDWKEDFRIGVGRALGHLRGYAQWVMGCPWALSPAGQVVSLGFLGAMADVAWGEEPRKNGWGQMHLTSRACGL